MKVIIIVCLLGVALASPQRPAAARQSDELAEVLRSDISPVFGAKFKYLYEISNGIFVEKEGTEGSAGQSNMAGTYRFISPEGETVEVRYVADENGFQPESAHLPVAPPMPAHSLEQIRIGEQLRAQGVRFDDQGFRI